MKIIAIFLVLFLFPVISAVGFDIKAEYNQEETIIAKVSGNFVTPILKENIFFYKGHVKIPIEYDVAKIEQEYYIYASLLGKTPDNYSLAIKNTKYMKGSQVLEDDIIKNFTITNKTADFSLKPGFVVTNKDFFLEVQNLQNFDITIDIKLGSNTSISEDGFFASLFSGTGTIDKSIDLFSGQIEKINFELGDINQSTLKTIELSTENTIYRVPVYLLANKTREAEKQKNFRFEPSEQHINMSTDHSTPRTIYLYNDGDETIENISISVSDVLKPYLDLSIKKIKKLDSGKSVKIELLFSSGNEEKIIKGQIRAKSSFDSDTIYAYYSVFLNFIPGYILKPEETQEPEDPAAAKTCAEMNGKICESDETCSEATVNARDANCCLATCKKEEKSSTGKIIGWSIVILIIVFLMWFFKSKYKRAKKKIDLFEIAKAKKKF